MTTHFRYTAKSLNTQKTLRDLQTNPNSSTHEVSTRIGASYQVVGDVLRSLVHQEMVTTAGVQIVGNHGHTAARYTITPAGEQAIDAAGLDAHVRTRRDPRPAFTRQVLLDTITRYGPLPRSELVQFSGLGLSTLVSYLTPMVAAGTIKRQRSGREAFFSIGA